MLSCRYSCLQKPVLYKNSGAVNATNVTISFKNTKDICSNKLLKGNYDEY